MRRLAGTIGVLAGFAVVAFGAWTTTSAGPLQSGWKLPLFVAGVVLAIGGALLRQTASTEMTPPQEIDRSGG